jgi:PhzF family phenazine biosynthesis protein
LRPRLQEALAAMPSRTVTVYQVDAFTRQLFAGNPAGVVLGAEVLSDHEMQALARELNNSDTAFVLPADDDDHDIRLRFFTPEREVSFVGHATLAAQFARVHAGQAQTGTLRQKSRAGIYEVEIARSAKDVSIAIYQPPPVLQDALDEREGSAIRDALGFDSAALDPRCPLLIAGRDSTRLMVGLRSADLLASLTPDFEALKRLSPHLGADGYFLFVRDAFGANTTDSRMFCPVIGIPEDPVSGNAHGMLGAYLVQNGLLAVKAGRAAFIGHQGRTMERPGQVHVEVEGESGNPRRVRISGTARIVFRTEIALD